MVAKAGKPARDKRTAAQWAFDQAKHGWAFCNANMLRSRIEECTGIAEQLDSFDQRHGELKSMVNALDKLENDSSWL